MKGWPILLSCVLACGKTPAPPESTNVNVQEDVADAHPVTPPPPPPRPLARSVVLSAEGYAKDCAKDADCVAVYEGDLCERCSCANTAIAKSANADYRRETSERQKSCAWREPRKCQACAPVDAVCASGTCALRRR